MHTQNTYNFMDTDTILSPHSNQNSLAINTLQILDYKNTSKLG